MKAVQLHRYGAPEELRYESVALPTIAANEVLVQVAATSVNPKDCLIRKGKFRFLTGRRFPIRLGNDLAGTVVDRGRDVNTLDLDQPVFGMTQGMVGRAYAEYVAVRTDQVAPAPAAIPLTEAGALPLVSQTALQALRDLGRIVPGHQVCINGASGGVGTVAIQIAKAYGAHVTAVCSSRNGSLCRDLGADQIAAYDAEDLLASTARFDIFFDVFGNHSFGATRHLLRPTGQYISAVPSPATGWAALRTRWSGQRAHVVVVRSRRRDLLTIAELVQTGQLRPVIDRSLPLSEAGQAHAHVQTKRARGKVLLTPD
ncbi:MAG: NAD(P)-dependent alcohol dehydrogenase [Deltaproteobacteria bacterium]|nr:NAD(P)-dependent alcohol dehydrogenase [Deltaproteobacteria bacterium]